MSTNTPPFNEKEFLMGLLSTVQSEYGSELRFIMEHKFDSINLDIIDNLSTLKKLSGDIGIKKYINQWFKEAEIRGIVEVHQNHQYKFTPEGYKSALAKKSPLKCFYENHWRWFIGILIGVLSIVAATIIKLIQCQC